MSAKPKTLKLKPRRMWMNVYGDGSLGTEHDTRKEAILSRNKGAVKTVSFIRIPLDDVEGLVEKALAAYRELYTGNRLNTHRDCMTSALRAIGIPVKKEGRK